MSQHLLAYSMFMYIHTIGTFECISLITCVTRCYKYIITIYTYVLSL